jgi:hypothetical protein
VIDVVLLISGLEDLPVYAKAQDIIAFMEGTRQRTGDSARSELSRAAQIAEVNVQIFRFHAPGRKKPPLEASSYGPACLRC